MFYIFDQVSYIVYILNVKNKECCSLLLYIYKCNKCGNLQEISMGLHLFASWDLQIYRLSTEKIKIRCYSVSFGIIHASRKEKEKLCVYTTANFSIAYEKLKFITITKKKHVANTAPKKSCYT